MSLLLALTASGGSASLNATLAVTLADVTPSASLTSGHGSALSIALGDVSVAVGGSVGHSATSALTLGDVSVSTSAAVGHAATSVTTLGDVAIVSAGVGGHTGILGAALSDVSVAATATASGGSQSLSATLGVVLDGITVSAETSIAGSKVGGDDAYHHPGWNKSAWKKKQAREEAITETIEATYRRIMGIEPDPVVVAEVKQSIPSATVREVVNVEGYAKELEFIAWLKDEIARIQQEVESDDEETLLMLL